MEIRKAKSCLHVNYKSVLCVCACVCARLSGDAVTWKKPHKRNGWLVYIVNIKGMRTNFTSEVHLTRGFV